MSIEKYGLKTIPFQSQGSETGKYPFVPSESFNLLISEIDKIQQQKDSGAIIVQGPQGSGKTATKKGLVEAFSSRSGVGIITVHLSSIDLGDLAWSIIDEAKKQDYIDNDFLEKNSEGEELKNFPKPKLEQIITKVLEKVVSKNAFGILIIDEFDIISQPTFHDTNDQTIFLHAITNILNSINESKIIQEKSFCTILAQTDKSSEDFRDYISNRHKPLSSRLKRNIDIEYDFDVTKKIVQKRLEHERIPEFEMPSGNELFPLDDEIVKFLYKKINHLTQSPYMKAFREMEQILHDSIEKSLENNLSKVDIDIVKKIFEASSSKLNIQKDNIRKISIETKNELENAMKDADQFVGNNLYLNGIMTGMKIWEKREYSLVESDMASSRSKNLERGIFISSIKIKLKTTDNISHEKNIFWYAVSKSSDEPYTDEDYHQINSFLDDNKDEQLGSQRSILTIFTEGISEKSEQELQNDVIPSVDRIFYRSNFFKQAIVGIFLSKSDEEREQFRPEWDAQLHNICSTYLGATLFDLGAKIDSKHVSLIQFLFTKSIVNQKFKKDDWLIWGKRLSGKMIQDKIFNQIKILGFTNDDYAALVPRNLKSLKILIDSKDKDKNITNDEFRERFGNDYALNAAQLLGIINEKNQLNIVESIKEKISDELIDKINAALPENSDHLSDNLQILKLLKDAFYKIDSENDYFKKIIVLQFILNQGHKSLIDLGSDTTTTSTTKTENDQSTDDQSTDDQSTDDQSTDDQSTDDQSTDDDMELSTGKIIETCKLILTGKKLKLSDLRQEIAKKPGFADQSKWVNTLLGLVRDGTILLAVDD